MPDDPADIPKDMQEYIDKELNDEQREWLMSESADEYDLPIESTNPADENTEDTEGV